jgi:hypothetical protein
MFGNTIRLIRLGLALCCLAKAQYSDWKPIGNTTGLTWRWQLQTGSMKTCLIEIREGEKLRTTTANLKIHYLLAGQQRNSGQSVSFTSRDTDILHLSSCERIEAVTANRVRRK